MLENLNNVQTLNQNSVLHKAFVKHTYPPPTIFHTHTYMRAHTWQNVYKGVIYSSVWWIRTRSQLNSRNLISISHWRRTSGYWFVSMTCNKSVMSCSHDPVLNNECAFRVRTLPFKMKYMTHQTFLWRFILTIQWQLQYRSSSYWCFTRAKKIGSFLY